MSCEPQWGLRAALACGCLLAALGGGCRRDGSEPPLPAPVTVDFGDPAQRSRLAHGWSVPEHAADGSSWVWATATEARVEIDLETTAYDQLGFRGWPLAFPGSPRQVLGLTINGQALASVELRRRPQTYAVAIPAGALVRGRNLLDLSFTFADSPARLGDEATLEIGREQEERLRALGYLE